MSEASNASADPGSDRSFAGARISKFRLLPRLEDLPIPENIQPQDFWSETALEMADHIGAYATLCVMEAAGGGDLYIPADPALNPFRGIIGDAKAATLSFVYGRERLPIPVGTMPLAHARRQRLIASVRAGRISVVRAAGILGVARRHLSRIVNQTSEGIGYEPLDLPEPRPLAILRMAVSIVEAAMITLGAPIEFTAAVKAEILDLWFNPHPQTAGEHHAQIGD